LSVEGILFDLDGTLVDTAPDLVAVLNRLLLEHDAPPMPYAIARNEVSNGASGLIRLGFGSALAAGGMEALRTRFLDLYMQSVCAQSRLFIDVRAVMHESSTQYRWGVVTNKPKAMTIPLLEQLGVARLASCIVSGDSLPQRKPHPAPLLLAAEQLGLDPADCIYVGDAIRDIEAGRAAGMRTWAALWGYIRPNDNPAEWAADALIPHPRDLAGMLASGVLHPTGLDSRER
jgi:phosphoglycolate phosphatase